MESLIICLTSKPTDRYPSGTVMNQDMEIIGDAQSYTYGGNAFAVHTKPFAGWIQFSECEFYRKDAAGFYPVSSPSDAEVD